MGQRRMKRSRRLFALLLAVVMAAAMVPAAMAADGASGLGSFKKIRSYEGFSDVAESAWYYNDVRGAYELGLINGSNGKFNPDGYLTLAEAITMACNVCNIYADNNDFTPGGSPWYQNAVDYAKYWGIIQSDGYGDYTAQAARADVARIFASCLGGQDLKRINRVSWIPDVDAYTRNFSFIYVLYNAGVLTGGGSGEFRPNDAIKRSEAAAILNRLVDPSKRVQFTITGSAPGILLESDDSVVRVSCASDHGWKLRREYAPGKSAEMLIYREDNSGQIDILTVDKNTTSKTIKEWSESAADYVLSNSSTAVIDHDLAGVWIRGLDGYNLSYHYSENGKTYYGEYLCVENSTHLVYMWMLWAEDCTDQVYDDLWDILDTLDLSL